MAFRHAACRTALGLAASIWLLPSLAGGETAKDPGPPLNDVSLEVAALQALHDFQFSPTQMRALQRWAGETAQQGRARAPGRASREYREKLQELHSALVDAFDDDLIDQLAEQVADLREQQKPALEDDVELTMGGRRRAPEALRLLGAGQLAGYLGEVADEVGDPLDKLVESLPKVRALKGAAWREKRDEVADEVARLLAGVDAARAERVSDQVIVLLTRAHGMNDQDFAKARPSLEAEARQLAGAAGPLEVLRNHAEYALAELLSNPRLAAALEARLK